MAEDSKQGRGSIMWGALCVRSWEAALHCTAQHVVAEPYLDCASLLQGCRPSLRCAGQLSCRSPCQQLRRAWGSSQPEQLLGSLCLQQGGGTGGSACQAQH